MCESVHSPALQEEVSARDAARAALQQLTEFLGTRHGTGQALCITAAIKKSLCSGSSLLAADNACMRSLSRRHMTSSHIGVGVARNCVGLTVLACYA